MQRCKQHVKTVAAALHCSCRNLAPVSVATIVALQLLPSCKLHKAVAAAAAAAAAAVKMQQQNSAAYQGPVSHMSKTNVIIQLEMQ